MQIRSALRSAVRPAARNCFTRIAYPPGTIFYADASRIKPTMPVTYNGKYLVVKNV